VTITIRPAVEADLPALLGLYAQLHPDDPVLPAVRAAQIWREIAGQPGRRVLLATMDEAVVGTMDCAVLPNLTRSGRPFMLVENVVVATAARRQGVGRRLLAAAVAGARAEGCYKVQLLSRSDRADAHAFYESCGFRSVAAGYRRYLDDPDGGTPSKNRS
jgi:ribosomal protein S18 acetylase RimI-like enzyme